MSARFDQDLVFDLGEAGQMIVSRFNLAANIQKILIATPAFMHDPKGAATLAFQHADALFEASELKLKD